MGRRSSCNSHRKSSTKRRTESLGFDEFGFALSKRKERKLQHRCHDYSFPHLSATRVKELCELLSYWNGSSFICRSQIERFIRMGIPPSLRGLVWKCLLNIDRQKESSAFNYQTCLTEIRGPLVDLGVSEYSILSAIATLSDTENDLGAKQQPPNYPSDAAFSSSDVTLFRQIALDLQRSFPTHRSLMGESPEAIEGQAKLFRVLIAYAKYNPEIGYSQGMSYIAAVLLMHLSEEEAFWALVALLEKPQYLAQLFDLSLNKVQHQVKVFHQLLKHRKPLLSQHLEDVGVSSVHFVMPWFLTLFTSLPCWDSVLTVWDLVMLHGLSAMFRTGLTIIQLLESRLLGLTDVGSVLPLLLRVPVDVSQYSVLIPALWSTEVQDWEIKCMNSLVLEETHHRQHTEKPESPLSPPPSVTGEKKRGEREEEKENVAGPVEEEKKLAKKDSSASGPKAVFSRMLRLAQRYLQEAGRFPRGEISHSPPGLSSPAAPGRRSKTRVSSSLAQAQIRARRRSQRGVSQHGGEASGKDPSVSDPAGELTALLMKRGVNAGTLPPATDTTRPEQAFVRNGTRPVGRVARRRSSSIQPIRIKSLRLLRTTKTSQTSQTMPPLSSTLPSSLVPADLSPGQAQQPQSPHTALPRELSTRCQGPNETSNPPRSARESQLI